MSKGGERGEESSGSMRPAPKVDGNEASRVGRAGEEVTRGMRKETAFGAEGIRGRAEPGLVATQLDAMPGPETRKAGADDARERGFRRTNRRRVVWWMGQDRHRLSQETCSPELETLGKE